MDRIELVDIARVDSLILYRAVYTAVADITGDGTRTRTDIEFVVEHDALGGITITLGPRPREGSLDPQIADVLVDRVRELHANGGLP